MNQNVTSELTNFNNSYILWQDHINASDIHYIFNPGDHVKLHGLNNNAMNGKEGVVSKFIPKKCRYEIINIIGYDNGVCVKLINLEPIVLPIPVPTSIPTSIHTTDNDTKNDTMARNRIRERFFQPGMKYTGTIQIPGDAGMLEENLHMSRQTYELTIVEYIQVQRIVGDGKLEELCKDKENDINEYKEDNIDDIEDKGQYNNNNKSSSSILARHYAYGDEQYVFIEISDINISSKTQPVVIGGDGGIDTGIGIGSGTGTGGNVGYTTHTSDDTSFSISFADGETICNGQWNPEDGSDPTSGLGCGAGCGAISGSVQQLVNPIEQIYHKNDPVTHTFILYPCVNTGTGDEEQHLKMCHVRHNTAIYQSSIKCLESFCRMWSVSSYEEKRTFKDIEFISNISWNELFKLSVLEAERGCAIERARANILNKLKFNSIIEKKNILKYLSKIGYNRSNAHSRSDTVCSTVRDVGEAWHFYTPISNRNRGMSNDRDIGVYTTITRVDQSYSSSSDALERCLNRLTTNTLSQFKCVTNTSTVSLECNEDCCPICMIPLSSTDTDNVLEGEVEVDIQSTDIQSVSCNVSVLLPCNHNFHEDCIQQWLHNHTECPICRAKLIEFESDEQEREDS